MTNNERLFHAPNQTPYVKDGINNYIVNRDESAVNPQNIGTKAAVSYRLTLEAGQSQTIRLRLSDAAPRLPGPGKRNQFAPFGAEFDAASKRLNCPLATPQDSPENGVPRHPCHFTISGWQGLKLLGHKVSFSQRSLIVITVFGLALRQFNFVARNLTVRDPAQQM